MPASVPAQVFLPMPAHEPGETVQVDVVYDGTRAGFIAASMAWLAQAPAHVTSSTIVFDGETIYLDAKLARSMTTN